MQIQIRSKNAESTPELQQHIERRLQFALGRFNGRVRLAVVRLQDLNGPKGGVDQECALEIHTSWHTRIHIEERDKDVFAAVSRAAERAGRAFERQSRLRYGAEVPSHARVQFGD